MFCTVLNSEPFQQNPEIIKVYAKVLYKVYKGLFILFIYCHTSGAFRRDDLNQIL